MEETDEVEEKDQKSGEGASGEVCETPPAEKKGKGKQLLILFLTYFKIGLFVFGGGYAMLALLEKEFVERKKWISGEEFTDIIGIAESTPGPIAINCATYIGYKVGKVLGAIVATLAVCIPSFVIIFVISLFFDAFLKFKYVAYAFRGIQACVVFLIASAGVKMFRGLKKNALGITLFAATLGCMIAFTLFAVDFSSVFYILIGGGIGVFLYLIGRIRAKKKQTVNATDGTPSDSEEEMKKEKTEDEDRK